MQSFLVKLGLQDGLSMILVNAAESKKTIDRRKRSYLFKKAFKVKDEKEKGEAILAYQHAPATRKRQI